MMAMMGMMPEGALAPPFNLPSRQEQIME